ncbi:hypothetical protein GCM10027321_34690 [Massilia terrae]|uniref:PilW family protein n=1 Tax=Massilia terrae TaxID=1811224 RepID=A0ABT2D346_9BURK|nr:PilW family protein [Massilia terrae]MCS0660678.1 PilW family protein [Massilia terrae]
MIAPRMSGMTLVELMIAMTLGLLILAGVARLFATANTGFFAQSDTAQADEAGRFALDVIGSALRQSAWVDWSAGSARDESPPRLAGLDANSISKAGEGISNPLAFSVNGSDVLSVRFAGAGKPPNGDGSMLSCGGSGVAGAGEGWSIFYVARGSDGTGELRCKYKASGGWSTEALIGGVDAFQVLYGVDTDEPRDGVPNRYVNATAIGALDDALDLEERNRRSYWKRVVSVQLALLLRGAKTGAGGGTLTYELFGPGYAAAGGSDPGASLQLEGHRDRRLFAATLALRGGAR